MFFWKATEYSQLKKNKFMKKAILSLFMAVSTLCCWAVDNNKLHVTLDVVNFGDSVVVIQGISQKIFTGNKGKFDFEIDMPAVDMITIVEPRALVEAYEGMYVFIVPAIPGESMKIVKTTADRYDVTGTGFYEKYHKVDLDMENLSKETRDLYKQIEETVAVDEQKAMKMYQESYLPAKANYDKKLMEYIKAHPAEETSVMLINDLETLEQVNEAVAALSPEVRDGRMKPIYESRIATLELEAREAEEKAKAATKHADGIQAPDFTLNDINGKPFSLSSLRGKYVVLDFWGSWCIWCIKGFPQMKEYYAKYAGKFEILGLDCNDKEEKWKASVAQNELPWLHVYVPRASSLLQDYGIMGFPTKIILDPEGKIVKTIVGEDPEFYTILDSLFGK